MKTILHHFLFKLTCLLSSNILKTEQVIYPAINLYRRPWFLYTYIYFTLKQVTINRNEIVPIKIKYSCLVVNYNSMKTVPNMEKKFRIYLPADL